MAETATAPEQDTVTRSEKIDLYPPAELRQTVIDAVRRYRACCRQAYACFLLAQTAGATIEENENGIRLTPDSDSAKIALAAAMGAAKITKGARVKGEGQPYAVSVGSGVAYELRSYVLSQWPTALTFVWDSLRRDIGTVWNSGDPEHPTATRGWLAMQGARGVAQFQRRAIGFPRATARPKLEKHALTLKWDHAVGPVEFGIENLDGGRYQIWRALRDGDAGWSLGTLYLTERDGKIAAVLSYDRPARSAAVDAERVLRITFRDDQEAFLGLNGPDGASTHDSISAVEVVAMLNTQQARRAELERRRAACGSPRRPWGHRRGWLAAQDVLSRCTAARERLQLDRNHAWTRRIVSRAISWRCGTMTLVAPPADIFGHPWGWAQFRSCLKYKANEAGITIVEES